MDRCRRAVFSTVVLALLVSACVSRVRNPFGSEGEIEVTLVNQSQLGVTIVVLGGDEPYSLGTMFGRETVAFDVPWIGEHDLRLRLTRFGGGAVMDTFPVHAKPGDRFIVYLGQDLRRTRVRRN